MSNCFPDQYSGLIHLIFLFIGIVIMDGGVNAAYTPFEALLDDMYHEQAGGSQRAFGMKSFMVSFGGSFGEFKNSSILETILYFQPICYVHWI